MKLASLRNGHRDGQLVLVSAKGECAMVPTGTAQTLQGLLDNWDEAIPALQTMAATLEENDTDADLPDSCFKIDVAGLCAPMPRAYQWLDGSGYLYHVELVRRARGASLPPEMRERPIMYQGLSDSFLAPREHVNGMQPEWGIDLEAELAVIVDDVPQGIDAIAALERVRLVTLMCDWSLRDLIPGELARGFGFLQSKATTSFAPFALTTHDLPEWRNGVLSSRLVVEVNNQPFGDLRTGQDVSFHFGEMIAHAAKTRRLSAGTIIGGGTVANRRPGAGQACIAELRAKQTIAGESPLASYLEQGDRVRIEAFSAEGQSLFGAIDTVVA